MCSRLLSYIELELSSRLTIRRGHKKKKKSYNLTTSHRLSYYYFSFISVVLPLRKTYEYKKHICICNVLIVSVSETKAEQCGLLKGKRVVFIHHYVSLRVCCFCVCGDVMSSRDEQHDCYFL